MMEGLSVARKRKVEKINPNAKKHEMKFGWCVTGHHSDCRKMYIDWNEIKQECNCNCHMEKK